jgi:hypothetical protein
MARRRSGVADSKAVLVAWDAGERISAMQRMRGYTRPTVRTSPGAAQRVGVHRGARERRALAWELVAHPVQALFATQREAGAATADLVPVHAAMERHVAGT